MNKQLATILLFALAACGRGPQPNISAETQPSPQNARFAQVDIKLNRVYQQAIANLDAQNKKALIDEEIAWIRLKDSACTSPSRIIKDSETCLVSYTEARIEYLLKVFPLTRNERLAGEYLLDPDGIIRIQDKDSGYSFEISVTNYEAHTGKIFGSFVAPGKTFDWDNSDSPECKDEPQTCCRLAFAFRNSGVAIEEKSCDYFHGANVSFSGFYRKSH